AKEEEDKDEVINIIAFCSNCSIGFYNIIITLFIIYNNNNKDKKDYIECSTQTYSGTRLFICQSSVISQQYFTLNTGLLKERRDGGPELSKNFLRCIDNVEKSVFVLWWEREGERGQRVMLVEVEKVDGIL